jgi:TPR repeat protein
MGQVQRPDREGSQSTSTICSGELSKFGSSIAKECVDLRIMELTMEAVWIKHTDAASADVLDFASAGGMVVAGALVAAADGDCDACFDLGVAYSTGSNGVECDLVEAHKWFNLAAVAGHEEAAHCRAEVSDDMTAREIAEAQRRARQWLAGSMRKAA